MPAGISALAPPPSAMETAEVFAHEVDKLSPAFTILQRDGLESSLPLLHVHDENENRKEKHKSSSKFTRLENARNDLYTRKRISKSNDHLVLASLQSHQSNPLKKKQSKSRDDLDNGETRHTGKSSMTLSTEDFNDVLNAKLRRIQAQDEAAKSSGGEQEKKSPKKSSTLPQRKPFITTVKCGEFLMPPPEVAALLGITSHLNETDEADACPLRIRLRPLVALNKRPEVRHSSHNARCQAALKATVDFSLGMINATTMAATTLEERARRMRSLESTTGITLAPRALPKKLEPIEGTMNMLTSLRGEHAAPIGNIMFDRRVVRGSTCNTSITRVGDGEQSIAARQAEARRRHMARKRAQQLKCVLRVGSPPPIAGRKHEPVQTDLYLEELIDKPEEYDVSTQTDYMLDRPETPPYCPAQTGLDACTQIFPGDLFDFDEEVQPILEVLVGKTVEQALLEVMEEEEIAALKEQQRRFQELRDAEKAEEERLEEQERRLREEKDRRLRQHETAMKVQQETEDRVAAAVLLTGYIAELLPSVLEGLKMSGYLLDEIKADVEEGFMPWLVKQVKKEVGNMVESREILMDIVREILEKRAETYRKLGEEYDASRETRQEIEDGEGEMRDEDFINYDTSAMENPNVF